MATSVAAQAPKQIGAARIAGTFAAMMLSMLGIDFLFNAGLLARYWFHPGPVLLPMRQLMLRIPFGYGSFLLGLALFLWVAYKIGVRTAGAGAKLGGTWGAVLGIGSGLGWFSIFPLAADFLAGVAVCQCVEYAVAGAIGGAGLGGRRVGKLLAIGFAVMIAGFAIAMIMQAYGLAPVERR